MVKRTITKRGTVKYCPTVDFKKRLKNRCKKCTQKAARKNKLLPSGAKGFGFYEGWH